MKDERFTIELNYSKIRRRFHRSSKPEEPKKGKGVKYKREKPELEYIEIDKYSDDSYGWED